MIKKIAYLGPAGTFTEEAAWRAAAALGEETELLPYPTISACAEAVEDQAAGYAVVPLENSLEGSVNETLDMLINSFDLNILAEWACDIEQNLSVKSGGLADITRVYSHPQALAQCRRYLRRNLPRADIIPVFSTAEAASVAAREGLGSAAICSPRAAHSYDLVVLARGIGDAGNRTRFIVLGKEQDRLPGAVKTTILFAVKNEAGSLYRVLQAFAANRVNLSRIESRPAKSQLGDYLFFVDLDGTPREHNVRAALREAAADSLMLKLLGAYPVLSG